MAAQACRPGHPLSTRYRLAGGRLLPGAAREEVTWCCATGRPPLRRRTRHRDFPFPPAGPERLIPVSLPEANGRPRFALDGASRLPLIAYHPRGLIDAAIRAHLARLGEAPEFSILNESIQSGNIRELVVRWATVAGFPSAAFVTPSTPVWPAGGTLAGTSGDSPLSSCR
ncbi:hypothetical protein DSL92_00070 [Billgrantia gudaonensis]|uniref:LysR substrate-binding domain-containing protein n=1 Tax=Billgrantia gudaonensis TaxID=376427 RepID=A0A3S0NFB5_9GAMM|nr:hypothetical protein DSL92_00070 [Halomonas gudaonensis]